MPTRRHCFIKNAVNCDFCFTLSDGKWIVQPRILCRRVLDRSEGSTYIGNEKFFAVIEARDSRLALRHKVVVMDVVGQQQHLYRWQWRKQKKHAGVNYKWGCHVSWWRSFVIYLQGLGPYMDFCWNGGCVRKIVWHIILVLKFHLIWWQFFHRTPSLKLSFF